MKLEQEIRKYLEQVKKQTTLEDKYGHTYLTTVGKTIISTLMYVLEDYSMDINKL